MAAWNPHFQLFAEITGSNLENPKVQVVDHILKGQLLYTITLIRTPVGNLTFCYWPEVQISITHLSQRVVLHRELRLWVDVLQVPAETLALQSLPQHLSLGHVSIVCGFNTCHTPSFVQPILHSFSQSGVFFSDSICHLLTHASMHCRGIVNPASSYSV